MADIFTLEAASREKIGTKASRHLRKEQEKVPAVIYGAGKETKHIELQHKDVYHALQHEAVFSHILTIKVDGKAEKVVLKAIDRHPSRPYIRHVDFYRIKAKEKITMHVPIHYLGEGESPGVKEGGVVSKHMSEVEIRCLPADLPENISIDVSQIELDGVLHLSDLTLPHGVELTVPELDEEHNQAIFSIHMPKIVEEVEEVPEEAEGEEGEEGEEGAEGEGAEAKAKEGDESEDKGKGKAAEKTADSGKEKSK